MIRKIAAALLAAFLVAAGIAAAVAAPFPEQGTWGGTSGGSANAQTLTIANYHVYTPGVTLRFIAVATNTGPTTLNVSGIGTKNVYRLTGTGPAALSGGEIVSGQISAVMYDGTQLELLTVALTPPVSPPQGRLTLVSGSPVMTSNQSGVGTIYYDPYKGNQEPIWNGTSYTTTTLAELSLVLSSSAALSGSNYDLFLAVNSGTPTLCQGPAWSSGTARSTTLSYNSGLLANASSMSCVPTGSPFTVGAGAGLYVGTFQASANGQTSWVPLPAAAAGGGNAKLFLWNEYNRVLVSAASMDNTASWVYSTAAWEAADASNSNRISVVQGEGDDAISSSYTVLETRSTNALTDYNGIGIDSTTVASGSIGAKNGSASFGNTSGMTALLSINTTPGSHFFQALEWAGGVAGTWYGLAAPFQMTLSLMGTF